MEKKQYPTNLAAEGDHAYPVPILFMVHLRHGEAIVIEASPVRTFQPQLNALLCVSASPRLCVGSGTQVIAVVF